ncbi:MAG: signal peptidase I [Clostridia bacterium]|nr:signal peptidase I [Clostridia bacterium]
MKKKWFILRIVLIIVISVVLGTGIYSWNAKTMGGNNLPMPFGVGVAVVISGSMEPELAVNDVIIVTEAKEYAVGDVVVFQDEYSLVVHRIISADGEKIVTQGDANNTPDAPITKKDIKGKVCAKIPRVGAAVDFLKSFPGTMMVLLLAGWLYFKSTRMENKADEAKIDALRAEIEALKNKSEK